MVGWCWVLSEMMCYSKIKWEEYASHFFSTWQLWTNSLPNWGEKPVAFWFLKKCGKSLEGNEEAEKLTKWLKRMSFHILPQCKKKADEEGARKKLIFFMKLTFRSLSFENQTSSSSTGASGRLRSSRERDKIRRRDTIVDVRWGSSSGLIGMWAGFSVFL